MENEFTPCEQHRVNTCYVNLRFLLDELMQIQHKDCVLIGIQRDLNLMEDVLHRYVGPIKTGG